MASWTLYDVDRRSCATFERVFPGPKEWPDYVAAAAVCDQWGERRCGLAG